MMKLTIINRLKLCFEILTVRSGHSHCAQEKMLSTFQRGYNAGMDDAIDENLRCSAGRKIGKYKVRTMQGWFHATWCGDKWVFENIKERGAIYEVMEI